ncbi:MAG: glycosyltransferase family 39 protein [Pseudomonadota bacterium]
MSEHNERSHSGFDPSLGHLVAAVVVISLAALVRLDGVAWDGFASLHADERHMIFVLSDMRAALSAYGEGFYEIWFGTGTSALDPRMGGRSHVYGEAPLLTAAVLAWQLDLQGWGDLLLLGRRIASVLDTSTVAAAYILAWMLTQRAHAALFAAIMYAASPTALQLSNFFVVDVWLSFAVIWCIVFLTAMIRSAKSPFLLALAAGAFAGLALGSKITGGLLAAPALVAAIVLFRRRGFVLTLFAGLAFLLGTFLVLRLSSPFIFEGPELWSIWPAASFVDDVTELTGLAASQDFPPQWQWMAGYPVWAFFRDWVLFGIGPVAALVIAVGCVQSIRDIELKRVANFAIPLALITAVAVWMASSFATPLRYGAPALPVLAVFSAVAIVGWSRWVMAVLAIGAIWWGSGVYRLHKGEHPRVVASRWLWSLPEGTVLANETPWDEGLPVAVFLPHGWEGPRPLPADRFRMTVLDITAADTPEKARDLARKIYEADYLILSSGRQRDVMPRLPDRFPLTAAYYKILEQEALCLSLALRVDRGYPLPMMRFPDSWAQENWHVFDHPVVEIYRRGDCYDPKEMEAVLMQALRP